MNKRRTVFIVALLVMVLLAVVAMPSFIMARRQSQRNACLRNLHIIASATGSAALVHRWSDEDPIVVSTIAEYMMGCTLPVCPSGGQYLMRTVGQRPECSVHGDLLGEVNPGRTGTYWLGMGMYEESSQGRNDADVVVVEATQPSPAEGRR